MAATPTRLDGYRDVDADYFRKRGLRRYAGVWSLWALGVGAVISGHFSGWNLGLGVGGFGGMLIAAAIVAAMYLCLAFSLAEMSPALPHTGGAYSFARTTMGPWGGFVTGLAENVEYVLTPAVIVYFIGAFLSSVLGTPPWVQPLYWVGAYAVFLGLNLAGVELSFRVSVVITLAALLVLAIFWISALPKVDVARWALNIGVGPDGAATPLAHGGGAWLPFGWHGVLATLPFAVWLFLAIEQLPLAAEEATAPQTDMPKGLLAAMATLLVSAFLTICLNSSIPRGAFALSTSAEPLLDGFRAIYGAAAATPLALIAIVGLTASFHTIIYAYGRQIYSLSRAGYFPTVLSLTLGERKTPHVALFAGALAGLAVMLAVWFAAGAEAGGAFIGGALLNMAVFGAMVSYVMQSLSFILLRRNFPHVARPYRSVLGVPGAVITLLVAVVTLWFQLADPVYRVGVLGVALWYAVGIGWFALVGRRRLVLSPEERFAVSRGREG